MTLPMVSDFGLRLAGGLAGMLLLASWRIIPLVFFRTHCLVMLGLLCLAALFMGRAVPGSVLGATVAAALLAYVGSATWGMGLPRVAEPMTLGVMVLCLSLLAWASLVEPGGTNPLPFALQFGARVTSSLLMGSTLTAMLLGHHYLTAPTMSIAPLSRFVAIMASSLIARSLVAGVGLYVWSQSSGGVAADDWPLFLGMRIGMGLMGPALATFLTWQTVKLRSTQSATGILYIAMTLVLFGEPTALILARGSGVVL